MATSRDLINQVTEHLERAIESREALAEYLELVAEEAIALAGCKLP